MALLAIHPTTRAKLENFQRAPSHAVLLVGAKGMGKSSIASELAEQLLSLEEGRLTDYAYVRRIASVDGKAIGIESIRELEHFLSLKVPGTAKVKRVVIIDDSQELGTEAQNALLKTLEEPPDDTSIILTAPSIQSLLPTIQSRLQVITVIKPSKADLQQLLPSENFEAVYTISGGLPGLAHAMLTQEDHPLLDAVQTARQLLAQSAYERLTQVDLLAKNKLLAQDTLIILQQMAHIRLQTATGNAGSRWHGVLAKSYKAAEALRASSQPKLLLTDLLLNL